MPCTAAPPKPLIQCLLTLRIAYWVAALGLPACTNVPASFGTDPSTARTNADELFGSFTGRFTNVYRTPRYAHAREMLGRHALTPAAVYNDTSIWTAYGPDGSRTLFGEGSIQSNRYLFTNAPLSTPLTTLGEGRHIMRLHKLNDNTYKWFTSVDFAAGHIKAEDAGRIISHWLASAEGRSGAQLRTETHTAFPRTAQALGKLFKIDTLISVRDNSGGNTVYLRLHLTTDGLRATLPHYAAYLDKYIKRIKLRFILSDNHGSRWFDATMHEGDIIVRARSYNGHFAPLEGGITQIPDTLVLQLDATAKVGLFTVGVNKLTGQWVNIQSGHERGWAINFTKEPDWILPPTVGFLLRSPLRRPFQGEGTQFSFTVHDAPEAQTLLSRRGSTTVQESAILRFLGHLGGTAMGDFVATAEEEENRFNASVFSALQDDMDTLLR